MIGKKSILITAVSIIVAVILAIWLYITFHILFIFLFIPLAFIGPIFGKKSRKKDYNWWKKYRTNAYDEKDNSISFPISPPSLPENTEKDNDQNNQNK